MTQLTSVSTVSIPAWRARTSLVAVFFCLLSSCDSKHSAYNKSAALEVWTVRTDEERPVAGVEVRALLSSGKELVSRYTGPDGQARWEEVEEGLVVRVEDPEGRYFPQERTVRNLKEPLLFRMREGVSANLEIRSAGDESPGTGGLGGGTEPTSPAVGEAEPKPSPPLKARVEAWPMDGAVVRNATRADGSIEIGPLPPGEMKLLISAEGHVTTVLDFTLSAEQNDLGQVILQPGGTTLKGKLLAREFPAELSFRFLGVSVKIACPADGSFEFTGLPPGRGILVGWLEGRELFRMPVDVRGRVLDLGEIDPELVAVSE